MKISEVFATIQGEGLLAGVPSLFIRTSGCNLRCHWCDTPYTSWNPEGEDWSLDRLLDWTAAHPAFRHVVLTGGEPMIQPQLPELTQALHARGLHITIETAGTVAAPVACDLMSISPKLANSTPWQRDPQWAIRHESARIHLPALRQLTQNHDYQLKFVVQTENDLPEIESLAHELNAPPEKILLMPEGLDEPTLRARALPLVELCKSRGYRFCPRLHIHLWGPRRGV
ncbi:MAG: 7-carboxy-7-deazaguanine synthase QueE [Bryobacteraceae bacterium]|nr:7-carboxy-7-deazaguanine synthase QueE [Solibacteraceae bacterium]MCO5349627.1 7-carboxy-7-deazaguanine synthase QueE [Bryobacteraceae bacterium]